MQLCKVQNNEIDRTLLCWTHGASSVKRCFLQLSYSPVTRELALHTLGVVVAPCVIPVSVQSIAVSLCAMDRVVSSTMEFNTFDLTTCQSHLLLMTVLVIHDRHMPRLQAEVKLQV